MNSTPSSNRTAQQEAEILVEVAKEMQHAADSARERARAACERANTLPLLERLKGRDAG